MQIDTPSLRRLNPSRVFYGWYIVAAGMGIHFWVSVVWIYGVQFFLTPITQTFGWSKAATSGAFSVQRLEGSLLTPAMGFLVDRFGPRKMVLAGVFAVGLGLVILSFIQTIWMFYIGVLVVSFGTSGTVGVPRNWAIVQWFRRLRGRALGVGSTGAVASGPLVIIVAWMVSTYGWRTSFLILGIASWAVLIPLALVYRDRPEKYGMRPDGDPAPDTTAAGGQTAGRTNTPEVEMSLTVREALKAPVFWLLILIFSLQTLGVNALNIHTVAYLTEDVGFSAAAAASVLGVYTVLSVFGRLGGGWAMDFLDTRLVLAALMACQAVGFLILANLSSYWMVFPYAFLYGTAFGGMMPSRGVVVSAFFGRQSFGTIMGLVQSGSLVGGIVGPVMLGAIDDTAGSYVPGIYILAAAAAAAIPLCFLLRTPRQLRQAAS